MPVPYQDPDDLERDWKLFRLLAEKAIDPRTSTGSATSSGGGLFGTPPPDQARRNCEAVLEISRNF